MARDACMPTFELEPLWTDELEEALSRTRIPPNAVVRPVPPAILELVERFAITYVTRDRMHARLQAMRERTAVALTPRGGVDVDHEELRREAPPNSHYEKFRRDQKQLRTRSHGAAPVVPPTRTIPGAVSDWGAVATQKNDAL
jgi:hypothetical protein